MKKLNPFEKKWHYRGMRRLFLILACIATSATFAWAGSITLNVKNRTLKEVLKEIEKQSNLSFIYSSNTVDVKQNISFDCRDLPVEEVLKSLLVKAKISFTTEGNQVILSPVKSPTDQVQPPATKPKSTALQGVVRGRVVDENGSGIPGASVTATGTTAGIATDIDGYFSLNVPQGCTSIRISFIGYSSVIQTIKGLNGGEVLKVTLNPDYKKIEEVVVTGYQTISKERATGSFVVLSPKTLDGKLQTNILDRLEGQVAGLSSYKGTPVIRGASTIQAEKKILYVVDGIPYEGVVEAINPSDIVNVTILKDATAASIYGARSSNGVIVITTRNGAVGKTAVSYNGSVKFQGLPDRDYLNRMNSSEFVDFQKDIFSIYPISRSSSNTWQNDVQRLLLDRKDGVISEQQLNDGLNYYRGKDRYNEVKNAFLRNNSVTHQHNISFGGGDEVHRYNLSLNYMQDLPYEKEQSRERLGFNIKNTFNFFKWMKADVAVLGSSLSSDYDNGISGMAILNGGPASYYTLRDENGNPNRWYAMEGSNKSQKEIDRLISLGLFNENYTPLNEMGSRHYSAKSRYLNLNLGVTFKLCEGLNAEFRYQNENTDGYNKQYDTKDANKVKRMVNDATQILQDGSIKYNIPKGGTLLKNNFNSNSYTLRAQLNYTESFKDLHDIQAIVGAERRKVVDQSDGVFRLGYDDETLVYSPFDELVLNKAVTGTQSQNGSFYYSNFRQTPTISYTDNRYLSYYANASYTYGKRTTLNGSIRIDQSNLFGTQFRDQFKPLWSLGAHYVILQNYQNWIDRVVGRITYGVNGNVAKLNGPFTIVKDFTTNNNITNETQSYVQSPPNPLLRWERTAVTNIGVDFVLFNNRISGSVEYYNKKSSDLLGDFKTDPTTGWSSVLMNYGGLYNRGVEVTLNSINVQSKSFTWSTNFIFGYNKNEVTDVQAGSESAYSYYSGLNTRKGYPLNSLFSVRYAGLDDKGVPMAYKKDGSIVKRADQLATEDLEYSGTYDPPYNASLSNRFSYMGIDLSFMFVYYGGHVMRDVQAAMLFTSHPIYYTTNRDKDIINFWRKAGDEQDPDMHPAFAFGNANARAATDIWSAADKHVQKGDYIKLRDLTLGYTIPQNILKKTMVKSLRINLQAQNIWKWVANSGGLDPEVWSGYNLTPTRGTLYPATYTLGVSINF